MIKLYELDIQFYSPLEKIKYLFVSSDEIDLEGKPMFYGLPVSSERGDLLVFSEDRLIKYEAKEIN